MNSKVSKKENQDFWLPPKQCFRFVKAIALVSQITKE